MSHKYVLLKEVCEKASSNIAQKDLAECDGIYPIYGASGYIKSVDFFQQAKDYIAIVKDGAGIGRAMKLPAKSSVIGTMQYVLPNDNINISYLYYAICSMHLEKYFSGATIPHIYFRDYQNEQLPLPTLEEQAKIANVFGRIDYFIKKEKEQLINLDKLVKSRFIEMFGDPVSNPKGWILKKLSDLGQFKNGINFHFDDAGIEIYCLGVGNFKNNDVLNNMKELSLISLSNLPSEEYFLHDNDIVFVRSNGNKALVGRCLAVYPGEVPVIFSGFCIRFRKNNDSMLIPYLLHILKCESVRRKLTGRGANIQNLNQQILGNLIIPLPPLELQNRFATFVIETNKSKLAIQQSLDELETLKKSLMQQYFG